MRYVVPLYKDIPSCLLSLTVDDINTLRPFYFHFEQYERKSHGYQVKCCPIKLRTSEQSVEEKIHSLNDATQKERCQNAYDYLVTANDSSYSHFLRLREKIIAEGTSLNLFHFSDTRGMECALWPNLYPFSTWCESNISDSGSRLSMKVSFDTKLLSETLAVQNSKWRHQYCTFSQVFTSSFFRHKNLLCYLLAVATSISFRCCSTVWPA